MQDWGNHILVIDNTLYLVVYFFRVNCSSENLAIAIHTEISSDVEQQEKNESILVTHSDSFG